VRWQLFCECSVTTESRRISDGRVRARVRLLFHLWVGGWEDIDREVEEGCGRRSRGRERLW
jgi:hypothetical protein